MTNIIERLRYIADAGVPVETCAIVREAADEIERLTAALNKYELAALQARTAQRRRDD